jgi:hypothetical protein
MGIKIYIHGNPKGPIQGVRIRYGFEALAGRDLFAVHVNMLDRLKEIGFTVQKEIVSRIDLQVMLFRAISELITPVFCRPALFHVVFTTKITKNHEVFQGNR